MPLFFCVSDDICNRKEKSNEKQDPPQWAQWTELAGLSALAVNLHRNSFWADSVMGLLLREAIESLLAFLLSAHDLSQGQGEVNKCRNHSPEEMDDSQKPRKGVGMTRKEVRGRVLLMEARSQFEAQAEGSSTPGLPKRTLKSGLGSSSSSASSES